MLAWTSVWACGPGAGEQDSIARGDLAFARDSLDEALAEYRLAISLGFDEPAVFARVAHSYARIGRVDESRGYYWRAVDRDSAYADQAAADLVWVAREADQRRDYFQMASAMAAAMEFRPGVSVEEMALPLARHYFESGQYGRALPFYQKALATRDSAPDLVFEIGLAYEEIGDCELGLEYFERYRSMLRPWERDSSVDWHVGNCALGIARERRLRAMELPPEFVPRPPGSERLGFGGGRSSNSRRGRGQRSAPPVQLPPDSVSQREESPESRRGLLLEARRYVERAIEMDEPRNLMSQAWFERGEILSALGECDEAIESFDEIRFLEPSESTALARRARERFDDLRFGRGLESLRSDGSCG